MLAGRQRHPWLSRTQSQTTRVHRISSLKVNAYSELSDGRAESKCPVGRMFGGLLQPSKSHQVYDPEPFTSNDYQGAKYRMSMGLTPMKHEKLIEIDEEYEDDMELRRTLLQSHRGICIQSKPEAEAANRELLEILVEYLPRQFPDRFEKTADDQFVNKATNDVWDLNAPNLDPLEVSAMLVQEDLCLMQKNEKGELKFVSGAVLFPQRWSLIEKIGMNLNRIHEPVPLYENSISKPVNVFMERLEPKRPFERCNWTIADNPAKFQPLDEHDIGQLKQGVNLNVKWQSEPITSENAGERLCTRMERETLSRLPKTQAILFTIKTYMKPLGRFADRPEKAMQLAKALRTMDPGLAQYKTINAFKQQALDYLDRVSEGNPAADQIVPTPAPAVAV